jgi:iron complex outermembrane receptor protein
MYSRLRLILGDTGAGRAMPQSANDGQPAIRRGIRAAFGRATLAAAIACALATPVAAAELEEIIVTAQKRTEDLQKVGISVDSFRAEDLRELGMHSLADVTKFSNNVQLYDEYGSGQPTWVIRGVGLQDFNANNTPTAAIYIDDVYQTSNVMGSQALYDLERIEVLKGPQGALYGRNTSGGAVRVLSKRPDPAHTEGYAYANYGRWDDAALEGALNVPLSDSAAVRVAGRWNGGGEGWQQNVVTGEEHGKPDRWAVRASLLSALGENGEVLLRVHGAADTSETVLGQTIGLYSLTGPGYCAPILAGHLDDSQCAAYSTFYDFRLPDQQSSDGRKTLANPINQLDNSSAGASLQFSWDFEGMTLTSITGYEDFQYGLKFDYDGGFGEYSHQDARTDIKAWSQEFRLASTGNGPLQWQFGLEYAHDELVEDREFKFKDDIYNLVLIFGGQAGLLGYDQTTESWAAWGQVGWQVADSIRLNAGVRYTDEQKSYKDGGIAVRSGGIEYPFFTGLHDDLQLGIFSGKLGVDWVLSDSAMLYASISRGFKSGGFFGGFPSGGESSIRPYDEETVNAYEVGLKSQWFDNTLRLNLALFHYDYFDAQGYVNEVDDNGFLVTRLGNIGDAEHDGVEVEVQWVPTEHLSLEANAAWLDAKYTDSDKVVTTWLGTTVPFEGMDRSTAPDFSYNLVGRYTVPIGDALETTLQLDYNWRDNLGTKDLSVIENTMTSLQDAYGLLGARLSLAATDGAWEVALWGRNLADEKYVTNVTNDNVGSWIKLPGQPMSYGIEGTYRW